MNPAAPGEIALNFFQDLENLFGSQDTNPVNSSDEIANQTNYINQALESDDNELLPVVEGAQSPPVNHVDPAPQVLEKSILGPIALEDNVANDDGIITFESPINDDDVSKCLDIALGTEGPDGDNAVNADRLSDSEFDFNSLPLDFNAQPDRLEESINQDNGAFYQPQMFDNARNVDVSSGVKGSPQLGSNLPSTQAPPGINFSPQLIPNVPGVQASPDANLPTQVVANVMQATPDFNFQSQIVGNVPSVQASQGVNFTPQFVTSVSGAQETPGVNFAPQFFANVPGLQPTEGVNFSPQLVRNVPNVQGIPDLTCSRQSVVNVPIVQASPSCRVPQVSSKLLGRQNQPDNRSKVAARPPKAVKQIKKPKRPRTPILRDKQLLRRAEIQDGSSSTHQALSSSTNQAVSSSAYRAGSSSIHLAGYFSTHQAGSSPAHPAGSSSAHQAQSSSTHQAGSPSAYQVAPLALEPNSLALTTVDPTNDFSPEIQAYGPSGCDQTYSSDPKATPHPSVQTKNGNLVSNNSLSLTASTSGSASSSDQPLKPAKKIKKTKNPRSSQNRYSKGASPSNYCHVCGRNSRIEFGQCQNVKLGLCRKVMCEKCLILYEPQSREKALSNSSDWQCTHCRDECPERARCKQYTRNNQKRREKKARERAGTDAGPTASVMDQESYLAVQPRVPEQVVSYQQTETQGVPVTTNSFSGLQNQPEMNGYPEQVYDASSKLPRKDEPILPLANQLRHKASASCHLQPVAPGPSETCLQQEYQGNLRSSEGASMLQRQMESTNFRMVNMGTAAVNGSNWENTGTFLNNGENFSQGGQANIAVNANQDGQEKRETSPNEDLVTPTGITEGIFWNENKHGNGVQPYRDF